MSKSTHPDYGHFSIYLRKRTRKGALRKWEDEQPDRDFSDLVELLLEGYLNT